MQVINANLCERRVKINYSSKNNSMDLFFLHLVISDALSLLVVPSNFCIDIKKFQNLRRFLAIGIFEILFVCNAANFCAIKEVV